MSEAPRSVSGMSALSTALTASRLSAESPAWSLLRADKGPIAIAVLGEHLAGAVRTLSAPLLFDAVETDLAELRDYGYDLPRTAMQYCADWLAAGYLIRRPGEGREEVYELSEGALVAIRFTEQLADPRPSITASRLATIVDRIHLLAVETDPDVTRRIATLQAERDQLDARIAALRAGETDTLPADRAVELALDILALTAEVPEDFARVRAAMQQLNRDLRAQLIEEPASRGAVLDDIFRGVDLLAESDAGRSFEAFYALILDAERTEQLEDEVDELLHRPFARALSTDQARTLGQLLPSLQSGGNEIHQVMTSFSRSLRRFVQSQELAEDRRVFQMIREALGLAGELTQRVAPYQQLGLGLNLTSVPTGSVAAMRLHNPTDAITAESVDVGTAETANLDALRELVRASEIDFAELTANVNQTLAEHGPATIAEVLDAWPATQGVASVIGLLALAEQHAIQTGADRTEHVWWTAPTAGEKPTTTPTSRGATVPEYLFENVIA